MPSRIALHPGHPGSSRARRSPTVSWPDRYPEAPRKKEDSVVFLFERVKPFFQSLYVSIFVRLCVCESDDLCVCESDDLCVKVMTFFSAFAFMITHSPPTQPLYLSSHTRIFCIKARASTDTCTVPATLLGQPNADSSP